MIIDNTWTWKDFNLDGERIKIVKACRGELRNIFYVRN